MLNCKNYVRVKTLDEAYELNKARTNKIIAGMMWLRMSSLPLQNIIDISGLGLDKIEQTNEEFSFGAMVTLRQLETNKSFCDYTNGAIGEALHNIVGVQFRNMATLGGSIWSRFGFSDVMTLFASMDSYVELYKGGLIPMSDFIKSKQDNDILTRVIVKKTPAKFVYKSMRNQKTDLPVLTCAVSCLAGNYRVVIGARPGRAMIINDEKNLFQGTLTKESVKNFASYAESITPTQGNMRASAEYRSHLVGVLTERCLNELGGLL